MGGDTHVPSAFQIYFGFKGKTLINKIRQMCSFLLVSIYNCHRTEVKLEHKLQNENNRTTLIPATLAAPLKNPCEKAEKVPLPSALISILLLALDCLKSSVGSCTYAVHHDLGQYCCKGCLIPRGLLESSKHQTVQCSINTLMPERGISGD